MGVFGLIFPGVDNYAHAGGFAGGYLASLLLDPLKPERVDHMVIASSASPPPSIALAASVITALPLLLAPESAVPEFRGFEVRVPGIRLRTSELRNSEPGTSPFNPSDR